MFVSNDFMYPPPLKREDEAALMLNAKSGDTNARSLIILHNMRLVVKLAQKYANHHYWLEDLISLGTIGLIKAVDSFNPNLGYKFSTFASRCIENEILMFLRKEKRQTSVISLDAALSEDKNGNQLTFGMLLSTDSDIDQNIEKEAEMTMLKSCVEQLDGKQRRIMELRYISNNLKQSEVSKRMNVSQSYVSRLEKKAIQRLKKEMPI